MERKFYTNDFEQLLKENADQFRMSPSKKVWHGIYNDIHPGRRWPSIAMSLIFVFTLIVVGHLNTQQSQHNNPLGNKTNLTLQKNAGLANSDKASVKPAQKNISTGRKVASAPKQQTASLTSPAKIAENVTITENLPVQNSGNLTSSDKINTISSQINSGETVKLFPALSNNPLLGNDKISIQNEVKAVPVSGVAAAALETSPQTNLAAEMTPVSEENLIKAVPSGFSNNNVLANNASVPGEKISAPGTKSKTVASARKRKNARINWVYYLSPGFSYRTYSKQGNAPDQTRLGYAANGSYAVTHRMVPGLEGGIAMNYSLAKKLKLTSGFQVNYSAYAIEANNIHPIIATLVLHNNKTGMPYEVSAISYFGNGPGNVPVKLHNYNVQIALPVGLEYQIAGNEHLQFSLAGSLQPSFSVINKSFILSTDSRNYLTEPSLARRWNLGTSFGTFVSFKGQKLKWQIGPQVRYQLLSSYISEYQVREHYIDYNIRVAISKF